jgi:hypothetical protein
MGPVVTSQRNAAGPCEDAHCDGDHSDTRAAMRGKCILEPPDAARCAMTATTYKFDPTFVVAQITSVAGPSAPDVAAMASGLGGNSNYFLFSPGAAFASADVP